MRRIRTRVIVNPESNQGRTRRRWEYIKEAIRSFFREFRYEFTEKPLHLFLPWGRKSLVAVLPAVEMVVRVVGEDVLS